MSRTGRSGKRCVAFGCNNTNRNGVSLHAFPLRKPSLCRLWTKFVLTKRDKWDGLTKHSVLCSQHFTPECYPMQYAIIESMDGTPPKRKNLNENAIPTIHAKTTTTSELTSENIDRRKTDNPLASCTSKRPRTAFVKRENARIIEAMNSPVISPDWQSDSSLPTCLEYLFNIKLGSDVRFVVGDSQDVVMGHRSILICRSSVLCDLLMSHQPDPVLHQWVVRVTDTSKNIFNILLRYLYTDIVDESEMTEQVAKELIVLAKQYRVNRLVSHCEGFLRKLKSKNQSDCDLWNVMKVSDGEQQPVGSVLQLSGEDSMVFVSSSHQSVNHKNKSARTQTRQINQERTEKEDSNTCLCDKDDVQLQLIKTEVQDDGFDNTENTSQNLLSENFREGYCDNNTISTPQETPMGPIKEEIIDESYSLSCVISKTVGNVLTSLEDAGQSDTFPSDYNESQAKCIKDEAAEETMGTETLEGRYSKTLAMETVTSQSVVEHETAVKKNFETDKMEDHDKQSGMEVDCQSIHKEHMARVEKDMLIKSPAPIKVVEPPEEVLIPQPRQQVALHPQHNTAVQLPHNFVIRFVLPTFSKPTQVTRSVLQPPRNAMIQASQDIVAQPRQDIVVQPRQDIVVQPRQDIVVQPRQDIVVQPRQDIVVQPRQDIVVQPRQDIVVQPRQDIVVQPRKDIVVQPRKDDVVKLPQNVVQSAEGIEAQPIQDKNLSYIGKDGNQSKHSDDAVTGNFSDEDLPEVGKKRKTQFTKGKHVKKRAVCVNPKQIFMDKAESAQDIVSSNSNTNTHKIKPLHPSMMVNDSLDNEADDDVVTESSDDEMFDSVTSNNCSSKVYIQQRREVKHSCKQIYGKTNYCTFCGKKITKIKRHILDVHKANPRVSHLLSLPKKSKERNRPLELLANEGNFKHNVKVLRKKKGCLVVGRTHSEDKEKGPYDYIPCVYCKKFICSTTLWFHHRKCYFHPAREISNIDENEVSTNTVTHGQHLLHSAVLEETDSLIGELLSKMKNDKIKKIVEADFLIKRYAALRMDFFGEESQKAHNKHSISEGCRNLARLILEAKLRRPEIPSNLDYLVRSDNFDFVVECTRSLALKNDTQALSFPKIMENLLSSVVQIKIGHALCENDDIRNEDATKFQTLMEAEWNSCVNLASLKLKKANIQKTQLVDDLKLLAKHIQTGMASSAKALGLTRTKQPHHWTDLAKLTLCRLLLYNRAQRAEISGLKVCDYLQRLNWKDEDNREFPLPETDRLLANRMDMVIPVERSHQNVDTYVILPLDVKSAIDLLIRKRDKVGIPPTNPYIFARVDADTPVFGDTEMTEIVSKCPKLQHPGRIHSPALRKYLSTVSQILDMTTKEYENLTNSIGLDVTIPRKHYRVNRSSEETTKVTLLLLAVESGKVNRWKGKKLEDIAIDELPVFEEEKDEKEAVKHSTCSDDMNEGIMTGF